MKSAKKKSVKKKVAKPVAEAKPVHAPIPVHQWTNGGDEVLLVKVVGNDGKTSGFANGVNWNFQWPLTVGATVEAPDWHDRKECGGGLHGWPWGVGIGNGKRSKFDGSDTWIVFGAKPEDVVGLEGKAKSKKATIRFAGRWMDALKFVRPGFYSWVKESAKGTSASSGNSSTSASSGDSSTSASSGYSSTSASSGDSSTSASSGNSSTSASSGYSSTSKATGEASCAVCSGVDGRAMAGERSVIVLAWVNPKTNKREMKCAQTGNGDGSLKAGVLYKLDGNGDFVEVK